MSDLNKRNSRLQSGSIKLSLDERRRRLRNLAQTHPGLVLASALVKGDDTRSTPAERSPVPSVNQSGSRRVDGAEKAKLHDPAQAMRLDRPAPGKRTRSNRAAQLNLW